MIALSLHRIESIFDLLFQYRVPRSRTIKVLLHEMNLFNHIADIRAANAIAPYRCRKENDFLLEPAFRLGEPKNVVLLADHGVPEVGIHTLYPRLQMLLLMFPCQLVALVCSRDFPEVVGRFLSGGFQLLVLLLDRSMCLLKLKPLCCRLILMGVFEISQRTLLLMFQLRYLFVPNTQQLLCNFQLVDHSIA